MCHRTVTDYTCGHTEDISTRCQARSPWSEYVPKRCLATFNVPQQKIATDMCLKCAISQPADVRAEMRAFFANPDKRKKREPKNSHFFDTSSQKRRRNSAQHREYASAEYKEARTRQAGLEDSAELERMHEAKVKGGMSVFDGEGIDVEPQGEQEDGQSDRQGHEDTALADVD